MSSDISPIIHEKAPLILAEIKKAKSVLLHCHPSPDPDSIGSALAMKFTIEQLGVKATVIKGDSDIPLAFMHFPGAKEILQKNFFEIDLAEYDLFIILDTASPEMISQIVTPKFPLSIPTIVIDHHATNKSFADINLVDTSSPAVGFVLYQLFCEWRIEITHDIAINLFIGMYTDTGGFKYPPTDSRVLQAAGELVRSAPDFTKALFILENSQTKESIYFKTLALNSIETFFDDSIAITGVSYKSMQDKGISMDDIGGDSLSNALKAVIGWNIGISMIGVDPEHIKISIRTRDSEKFDVSKLASALGGGGHRAAAGAVLKMSLEDAKKTVVNKIKELYNL